MVKELLCRLPLSVKIGLSNLKTYLDEEKRSALDTVYEYEEESFTKLNEGRYRENLKKFLASSLFNAKETEEYIRFLYTDRIELIAKQPISLDKPTIICVVKNEADKLFNFFNHYSKLGYFNYVFIDNDSRDDSVTIMKENQATVYKCAEPFSTNRKIAWINKVYSTLPDGMWTVLLDADELLVYIDYENMSFNAAINRLEKKKINTAAAVMIDMFSKEPVRRKDYLKEYRYFENSFHEEKSYYFNSLYGGIREREFKFGSDRIFLIKKHPIVKKTDDSMLIHCHYIYPYYRNFESVIYFGLLHYKLFDSEIEKYKRIAQEGCYGDNSIEYKTYLKTFSEKSYEDIFRCDENTIEYTGTESLKQVRVLHTVGE